MPRLARTSLLVALLCLGCTSGLRHTGARQRAPISADACRAPGSVVSLDEPRFNRQLNAALYGSLAGLCGRPGTVVVPPGVFEQHEPVVVRSGQRIVGRGPSSVLRAPRLNNFYFLSNSTKGTGQPADPDLNEPASRPWVRADDVEIANLTLVYAEDPLANGTDYTIYHRAIVFRGWDAGDTRSGTTYLVKNVRIHDTTIHAVSGISLGYAHGAAITNNRLRGIHDFSKARRCYWKSNERTVGSAAGIVLGRMTTGSLVRGNLVERFGAEGITIDVSLSPSECGAGRALLARLPARNRVLENTVRDVGRAGIDVFGGNDNVLHANTVTNANMFHLRAGRYAAYVRGGARNRLSGNTITGYGVLIDLHDAVDECLRPPSSGNVVVANHLDYLGPSHAAASPAALDCGVEEQPEDSWGERVIFVSSPGTTISGNVIAYRGGAGPLDGGAAIFVRQGTNQLLEHNTVRGFARPFLVHPEAAGVRTRTNSCWNGRTYAPCPVLCSPDAPCPDDGTGCTSPVCADGVCTYVNNGANGCVYRSGAAEVTSDGLPRAWEGTLLIQGGLDQAP